MVGGNEEEDEEKGANKEALALPHTRVLRCRDSSTKSRSIDVSFPPSLRSRQSFWFVGFLSLPLSLSLSVRPSLSAESSCSIAAASVWGPSSSSSSLRPRRMAAVTALPTCYPIPTALSATGANARRDRNGWLRCDLQIRQGVNPECYHRFKPDIRIHFTVTQERLAHVQHEVYSQ